MCRFGAISFFLKINIELLMFTYNFLVTELSDIFRVKDLIKFTFYFKLFGNREKEMIFTGYFNN